MLKWRFFFSLISLSFIKVAASVFYDVRSYWINCSEEESWKDVRVICFLNHTSLFEPLFMAVIPWKWIWLLASKMVAPGADKTIKRPVVGRFFKLLAPGMVSITRKRDTTWTHFMENIQDDSIILILPEGRMKRANGLDKDGRPMSIRGGIADILERLDHGRMVIAYSLGLHHVQVPGQLLPKLFKKIEIKIEAEEINSFKEVANKRGEKNFRLKVVKELQERMDKHCPNKLGSLEEKE